jgi:hypothetical protein
MRSSTSNPSGVLFTDLDGTLLGTDRSLPARNLQALHDLGKAGIIRVVATGRSLHSFRRAVPGDLPVDYVIFSTGAGVLETRHDRILIKHDLTRDQLGLGREVLADEGIDHMIHAPIPDNHLFWYRGSGRDNPDYLARLSLLKTFGTELRDGMDIPAASQLLGIIPHTGSGAQHRRHVQLQERLPGLSVIRATSPQDHRSVWLEIFPEAVSKSRAAAWLLKHLGLKDRPTMAIGNDYNDQDLLEWAEHGFITSNGPERLKSRFRAVASNDEGGVAEAVAIWLGPPRS